MSLISLDFSGSGSEETRVTGKAFLMSVEDHSTNSSLREKLLEHIFIGDLLRSLWRQGITDIEVLRAEVDRGGYDLVLEANACVLRHVQLKSSFRGATTDEVGINVNLATKPSGCVLWIEFDRATLELGPFLWFGGAPGSPLPPLGSKVGKHSKGNSLGQKKARPAIRIVSRKRFTVFSTIEEVATALFGPARIGVGNVRPDAMLDPHASRRWLEKTGYAIGVPEDPDAIPEVRYQLLQGRVYTLKTWRDGSTIRGEIDLDTLAVVVGSTPQEGWYDALGNYLGDDPGLRS
jgi:hypothetical protein